MAKREEPKSRGAALAGSDPLLQRDLLPGEVDEDPSGEGGAFDDGVDAAIAVLSTRWAGPLTKAIVESLEELKR